MSWQTSLVHWRTETAIYTFSDRLIPLQKYLWLPDLKDHFPKSLTTFAPLSSEQFFTECSIF